eukprot:Skav210147  [mRNA]  locus=scaffold268:165657:185953:+ [translate_table: standard]
MSPVAQDEGCVFHAKETHDPVATPCCVAQDAWDSLVAGGGCGGQGPTEAECSAAMELCLDCSAAVQYYAHNATALRASDVAVDISSATIKCVLPQWEAACSGTVQGLGVGLLILTGVSLLVVATGLCIAFDWRLLPSLVARQRRKLLVEAIAAQDAADAAATAATAATASALGRAQPELPKTLASQRPRHYASAYALHTAFLTIAVIAVVLRVAYVVARGLLVVGLHLAHQCLPELLLCILPLAWVSFTSRRPKSSTAAVPMSVAYWGPWHAIPRFTTYAVCTICTEIYSTLVAALAVARLPCNASPVAGVLLYCVGLLVAVVRAYCAVLALRLQEGGAQSCSFNMLQPCRNPLTTILPEGRRRSALPISAGDPRRGSKQSCAASRRASQRSLEEPQRLVDGRASVTSLSSALSELSSRERPKPRSQGRPMGEHRSEAWLARDTGLPLSVPAGHSLSAERIMVLWRDADREQEGELDLEACLDEW